MNAFRLPCCDQSICETCTAPLLNITDNTRLTGCPLGQSSLSDTCPVCAHTPVSPDLCKPNKALRTTLKAFLRTEEKKREKGRQSAAPTPTVPTPTVPTPAESDQTPAEAPVDQAPVEATPAENAEAPPIEITDEPATEAPPTDTPAEDHVNGNTVDSGETVVEVHQCRNCLFPSLLLTHNTVRAQR